MHSFRHNPDPCYHTLDFSKIENDFYHMETTLAAFNCAMEATISRRGPGYHTVNGFKYAVRQFLSAQNIFP